MPYEELGQSVNIAVDEIGVKRQKSTRKTEAEAAEGNSEKPQYVHPTVAHIATEAGSYVVSGLGGVALLSQMLALLLAHGLAGRSLMVWVDGPRSLHAARVKVLGCWRSWQVILDWYPLETRWRENLSLARTGRLIRNQVVEHVVALLWDGRVGSALQDLAGPASEQIKNAAERAKLIGYLERQRPHIPCYPVRKQSGLRNSSNRSEKANDLVVAPRQKHNGMSWSPAGSIALAALATAARNQKVDRWFRTGQIDFKVVT